MYDAQIGLDLGESISLYDYSQSLMIHIWRDGNGKVHVSTQLNEGRDNLQIEYKDGRLGSVKSPDGEPITWSAVR